MDNTIWWPRFCGNSTDYDAFWSQSLTLNTFTPDLTRCFQDTVLSWVPAAVMLTAGSMALVYYCLTPTLFTWREKSLLNIAKLIFITMLLLCISVQLSIYINEKVEYQETPPSSLSGAIINIIGVLMSLLLTHLEFKTGAHTSGIQLGYWTLQLLASIVKVRSIVLQQNADEDVCLYIAVSTYISLAFTVIIWILVLIPDTAVLDEGRKTKERKNSANEKTPLISNGDISSTAHHSAKEKVLRPPESYSSYIMSLTFQWFVRLIAKGWRNPLVFEDIPDILDREKSKSIVPKFLYYYAKEQSLKNNTGPWGVAKALLLTIKWSFVLYNLMRLVTVGLIFLNPILLRQLLGYIESGDPYTWKGVVIAVGMLLASYAHSIFIFRFLYHAFNAGMHLRTAVTAAVYRKSLRLSSAARKQTTVGEIVNLMAIDSQKLQDLPSVTTVLWTLPLLITLSTYLLWQSVGPAALASLAVLAVVLPINGFWIASRISIYQSIQMKAKDKRIKTLNEVFSGIKVLKLYSWENSFEEKVRCNREEELKTIRMINILNSISSVVWNNTTYIITFAILATYVLSSPDNVLNPDKVFVTFSIVNVLNFPMQLLPLAVNFMGQALISLRRISKFLALEEMEEDTTIVNKCAESALKIGHADFSWNKDERPFLKDICLTVARCELVAVVGQVGSGKSSLISALLGEMVRTRGAVSIQSTMAYVPQQAWIQNATLQNNILFGRPMNTACYQEILDACALRPDLAILSDGDQTEIGEKGINLSGGQKQRVSLARAVYQDTNIVLLDDPLSAVDSHVAKHLFQHVIGPDGLLKHKSRILVTHGVTYLPFVDTIVVMRDGQVSEMGTYSQLLQNNGAFAEFLTTYLNEHSSEDDGQSQEQLRALQSQLSQTHKSETSMQSVDTNRSYQPRPRKRRDTRGSIGTQKSEHSHRRASKLPTDEPLQLIKQEQATTGSVKLEVVKDYAKAGGVMYGVLVVLFHACFMVLLISGQFWLSLWSNDPNVYNGTELIELQDVRLGVYGGLIGGQILSILVGSIALAVATTRAARIYHSRIVSRMLRVPMSFFDTTPLGRIINRCSKDVDYLDSNLPVMVRNFLFTINPLVATIVIVSYTTPIFLAVVVPVGILYYAIQRVYIATARQIRRIDSVRRSPIFAHFDETVTGATSIRAYGRVDEFIQRCDRLVDESQRAWYHVHISMRWLGITTEMIGSLVTFSAALFAVLQRETIGASLAGLSVSTSLQIALYMNFYVRASTELETYMVAAERIKEYSDATTEAEYEIDETRPSEAWPHTGEVTYKEYSTRYRPELDLVLKSISFNIKPAEKVGIVGRTGAGKSSMALSLFRIIEAASGGILIDGVRINELGLHDLRSRLTVIPQDPVVFSGTLRFNIDPLGGNTDIDLWHVLHMAHLKRFVEGLPEGLQHECGEGGESLSVGQRQLVCLARALLRKSKILVLDEATSGVDLETDDLIQATIRDAFKECTVITIAHRINTILDYDRVMVMDSGEIKEFASPRQLLQDNTSMFYTMAKHAGVTI